MVETDSDVIGGLVFSFFVRRSFEKLSPEIIVWHVWENGMLTLKRLLACSLRVQGWKRKLQVPRVA